MAERDISNAEVSTASLHSAHQELQRVILEMPDAVERLRYVGKKSEAAATDVLNLVDEAKASASEGAQRSGQMAEALSRLLESPDMDLGRARSMLAMCAKQMGQFAAQAKAQDEILTRIMLAQDFQDLTGQVIRKVCTMLETAEGHLQHVLVSAPALAEPAVPDAAAGSNEDLLGVQVPDKALQQSDVDDLLAEMGF